MIILGIDPGLGTTGWGVIRAEGSRLMHVAHGCITTDAAAPMARRLALLADGLAAVIADHRPESVAIEEIFLNRNPASTIKLAQARGCLLAEVGRHGLTAWEIAARRMKQALVGTGAAEKAQVRAMVSRLLPGLMIRGADAADALAVAIACAHTDTRQRVIGNAARREAHAVRALVGTQ